LTSEPPSIQEDAGTDFSVADELAAGLHIGQSGAVHHSTRNRRVDTCVVQSGRPVVKAGRRGSRGVLSTAGLAVQ
jgi:hypothetical protein